MVLCFKSHETWNAESSWSLFLHADFSGRPPQLERLSQEDSGQITDIYSCEFLSIDPQGMVRKPSAPESSRKHPGNACYINGIKCSFFRVCGFSDKCLCFRRRILQDQLCFSVHWGSVKVLGWLLQEVFTLCCWTNKFHIPEKRWKGASVGLHSHGTYYGMSCWYFASTRPTLMIFDIVAVRCILNFPGMVLLVDLYPSPTIAFRYFVIPI